MTTGQRLDILLRNNKITQEELSSLSGVSRQTINNIIKGKSSPSGDVLAKIKKALPHLNLNWLVAGSDSMFLDDNNENNFSEPLTSYKTAKSEKSEAELKKEVNRLTELIKQKDKTIEALQETVETQKQLINKLRP